MRPQHAREASQRAQTEREREGREVQGENMLQHAVCWLEKRVQNGMERTTVDRRQRHQIFRLFVCNKQN